jgi:hypothetical protein
MLRRNFLRWSAALGVGVGAGACSAGAPSAQGEPIARGRPPAAATADVPAPVRALKPMTAGIALITDDERKGAHREGRGG